MSYSTTQIATAIATAKCCMGDYTCKQLSKAYNGQEYRGTMLVNMELSLIIFSLEVDAALDTGECFTDSKKELMVNRINKLCQCDCTSISATTSSGVHTTSDHTTLNHTE